ncbi:LysM peptidoglycan-binding domain-containing protein [Virgibacillus ainsalahensis]
MLPNYTTKCLPGLTIYTVKEGENIYQIVQQFRIPLQSIQAANPMTNLQELSTGDTICLPMQQNFPGCSNGQIYFIQDGDSYYRLSQYFFIPLEQLMQANPNTDPSNLQIGQAICIPTTSSFSYCPDSTPYQIKQGDSFYELASKFNLSLSTVLQANPNVNPNQLVIGQMVCLPIQWKLFFEQYHHVAFMYPNTWERVTNLPIRYEGRSGYFEVSSISATLPSNPTDSASLDEVCQSLVSEGDYGESPTKERINVDGQAACLIYPSEGQKQNRASLIMKYPKPYVIGSLKHYLVIHADTSHIRGITSTVKLLNVEKDRNLTTEQAEFLVRRALGLIGNTNIYVTYDRNLNNKYLIHVYEIVGNHTATRGWYLVNPHTGEIREYV